MLGEDHVVDQRRVPRDLRMHRDFVQAAREGSLEIAASFCAVLAPCE